MGRKPNPYNQVLDLLLKLKREYPRYSLGQHISTALEEYGDVWGMTDNEILHALQKYELELEFNIAPEKEVEKILKEGQNLDKLFQEEEEDYE